MSKTWYLLVVPALTCMALLAPSVTLAGVHVGIGFGATIGPHYHHHMYGYYPYWSVWPGFYYYDPWWYYPGPVVVGPPVMREHVIVREYEAPAPPRDQTPDLASEKLQQQKSELLKKLKIGDPNNRVQAAKNLEQFEADSKVRTALEQALLSDRDPQVRRAVAELFTRVQDKKTLPVLKQANANDLDRDVRQAAYKAIIMIEGY